MKKLTVAFAVLATAFALSACGTAPPPQRTSNTVALQAAADKAQAATDAQNAADKAAADQAVIDKAAADKAAADKVVADKAAAAIEKARTNPASYKSISAHDYALVVKDPDSHQGERFIVYGYVTQFDAATATDQFLASTETSRQANSYEYTQNTLIATVDAGLFDNVVKGDLITVYVEVSGSFSYDTQIGGNTTVPLLRANIVKVTGQA